MDKVIKVVFVKGLIMGEFLHREAIVAMCPANDGDLKVWTLA
jgi:hypothetical protein